MRFAVLDGWRGICALVVALHHFYADGNFFHVPFVRGAWLFVDFFFVLSGFVIAHAYGKRLSNLPELLAFIARRLGRLWPLHTSVLGALVILEFAKLLAMLQFGVVAENPPFAGETSEHAIVANLLLVHALGIYEHETWNFPSWSISTEFWTYMVFAGLCLLGLGRSWRMCLGLAALGAGTVAIQSPDWLHTMADFGFFRCLFGFFVGCAVYRLLAGRLGSRLPAATMLEILVVALVIAFVNHGDPITALSMATPLVFALAVGIFAFSQGALSRLLMTAPARALGQWSYSIYLVHTVILVMVGRLANLLPWSLTTPVEINGSTRVLLVFGERWVADVGAVFYLATVVALASLTWRWIERPCQQWVGARLKVKK